MRVARRMYVDETCDRCESRSKHTSTSRCRATHASFAVSTWSGTSDISTGRTMGGSRVSPWSSSSLESSGRRRSKSGWTNPPKSFSSTDGGASGIVSVVMPLGRSATWSTSVRISPNVACSRFNSPTGKAAAAFARSGVLAERRQHAWRSKTTVEGYGALALQHGLAHPGQQMAPSCPRRSSMKLANGSVFALAAAYGSAEASSSS